MALPTRATSLWGTLRPAVEAEAISPEVMSSSPSRTGPPRQGGETHHNGESCFAVPAAGAQAGLCLAGKASP